MNSKVIFAGTVAAAVLNTASALPTHNKMVSEKQIYADTITNIMGGMVRTINSPECNIKPIVF